MHCGPAEGRITETCHFHRNCWAMSHFVVVAFLKPLPIKFWRILTNWKYWLIHMILTKIQKFNTSLSQHGKIFVSSNSYLFPLLSCLCIASKKAKALKYLCDRKIWNYPLIHIYWSLDYLKPTQYINVGKNILFNYCKRWKYLGRFGKNILSIVT